MAECPECYHHRRAGVGGGRRDGGRKANLASCLLASGFLILLVAAAAAVLFVLFRPRDPTIQVSAVQFPGFSSSNGSVSFTFAQYAAVRNPNRDAFSHYDSTLQLAYAGNQVGFMFIPAGQIEGGRTQYMAASFAVGSFPLATAPLETVPGVVDGSGAVEVESRMKVKGRVKVLRFFTHHVEATAGCRVGIAAGDGSVLGFRC